MSWMNDPYAEAAPERTTSAEAEFLKMVMRLAATECGVVAEVLHATASPNSVIATDLIARLNRIIDGLRKGAGEPSLLPDGDTIDIEGES